MERTFTYKFETKGYYLENTDEYEYDYNEYEYTANNEELYEAVVYCIYNQYFRCKSEISYTVGFCSAVKQGLYEFIKDNDNLEQLVEDYESELKEYFRDDAYEEYKNRG